MTDISQVSTPDGAEDRYRISHYIVQWFQYFENMYNVIVCADSSGGRMELYLFTISSLMAYAIVPCGVWQYRRESKPINDV